MSNRLQFLLHVRHVPQCSKEDLDRAYDLPGVKIELVWRDPESLFEGIVGTMRLGA